MTPEEINFYNLKQGPSSFKVNEPGLYKTRDGRMAYVSSAPGFIVSGVIKDDSRLYNWMEDGSRSKDSVSDEDLVEKWKD